MNYVLEAPVEARPAPELPEPRPAPDNASQGVLQGCTGLSLDPADPDPADRAVDRVDLPPMLPGLPNTPYRNCAALVCAIVWQAIVERDQHWCAGPIFNWYLSLLGWDNAQILNAKRAVLHRSPRLVRYSQANFLGDGPIGPA